MLINPTPAIPSDETFIGDGNALLDASASWQAGKAHRDLKTFQHRQRTEEAGSHMWYALVSVMLKEEISFEKLWSRMGNINMCEQNRCRSLFFFRITSVPISHQPRVWKKKVFALDIPGNTPQVYLGVAINMDGVMYLSPTVLASRLHSIKSLLVA